jgi:hypothetical protein
MLSDNPILINEFKIANFEVFYILYKSYITNYYVHNIFLLIEILQMISLTMSDIVSLK